MTNQEFNAWFAKHFRSNRACAQAMGWDVETVAAMRTGTNKRGNPRPIAQHEALACAAYTIGVREYDGGKVTVGGRKPKLSGRRLEAARVLWGNPEYPAGDIAKQFKVSRRTLHRLFGPRETAEKQ